MGLADDLKGLEQLHQQGKLSDDEFAAAKAAVIKEATTPEPVSPRQPVQSPPKKQSVGCLTVVAVLIGAFILLMIIVSIEEPSKPTQSTTTNENSGSPITGNPATQTGQGKTLPVAGQVYVRAAFEYLRSANAEGTQAATIWAGASNGTSTLDDCHIATRKLFATEKARYSSYRASRGIVPPAFADVDRRIGEIHKKSISSLCAVSWPDCAGRMCWYESVLPRFLRQGQQCLLERRL